MSDVFLNVKCYAREYYFSIRKTGRNEYFE